MEGRLAALRVEAASPTAAPSTDAPVGLRERPGAHPGPGRQSARPGGAARPTEKPRRAGGRRRTPGARRKRRAPSRHGTRLRWIRIALVLSGLAGLAMISTAFGMMMAVASELPALDNQAEFRAAQNSVLLAGSHQVAKVTGKKNRILLRQSEISPMMENAVIAIEDRRFFEHGGVDVRGILRALWADVRGGGPVQGASTLTQQFVKNALAAQGQRTLLQKLREAALAYHLERQWSKRKILTHYLNAVYFGNGAYGIESAVRTYFGKSRGGIGRQTRAASEVKPHEAALLAGIIASPDAYDPIQNPKLARDRRNLVLRRMLAQRMISPAQYRDSIDEALPAQRDISPPKPDSDVPYYSDWVTQQLVARYGAEKVFGGGLKVQTTLDPELQRRAERAISGRLAGVGPGASLVAIENKTGAVKAMVGGQNFSKEPFNVATNGHRQPGSALKPFTLVTALEQGVSPDRTFTSRKKVFHLGDGPAFKVENYKDEYAGVRTLRDATAHSDNSVFAELGLEVGTKRIARTAQEMGIRTPLSTNPAMTLGGLEQGVTPLELAYAYSTIANRGVRRSGSLASSDMGPVAIESVKGGGPKSTNVERERRVFSRQVGEEARDVLRGVIVSGTGQAADPQDGRFAAGKTGTTENYGDAWFVGFTNRYTIAVWVGYPDKVRHMKTEYRGQPVAGGTYPAEIWHDFLKSADQLELQRNPKAALTLTTPGTGSGTSGGLSGGSTGAGTTGGYGGATQRSPSLSTPSPSTQTPSSSSGTTSQGTGTGTPSSTGASSPSG